MRALLKAQWGLPAPACAYLTPDSSDPWGLTFAQLHNQPGVAVAAVPVAEAVAVRVFDESRFIWDYIELD